MHLDEEYTSARLRVNAMVNNGITDTGTHALELRPIDAAL